MKITARCHPALEPILPRPVVAASALPDWLRAMPPEIAAKTLGGASVRTLKHCPPIIDAFSLGLLIPLATDLTVENGELSWDWDPPVVEDADLSRAPVGLHAPEQATGAPFATDGRLIVKFTNFWSLGVEDGWSLLFTHPFNRPDLPFETLSGVVDCDRFAGGYVHFPALWRDREFAGVIPRGAPVAQVTPVRRAALELDVAAMSETEIAASREVRRRLGEAPGAYRRSFRR